MRLGLAAVALATAFTAGVAHAQDTTRAGDTVAVSPVRRPPLSPKRAFLSSLVLPGYSQSVLGRQRSGAMFIAFELASIVMIREATLGIREAKRNARDSVLVAYVDGAGAPAVRYEPSPFPSTLGRSRREQREDWIAVLLATHLFSGLDALVAANLWDLPAEVAVSGSRRSANLGLRVRW